MRSVVLALLVAASSSSAQWRDATYKDAITDQVFRFVEASAPTGETMLLTRRRDGSVWASVMTGRMLHPVEPKSAVIVRIDANDPMTYDDEAAPGSGAVLMQWSRAGVAFLVWHGDQAEGISPFLQQVLAGRSMIVRYKNDSGEPRDAAFNLANSRRVEQLLGLPAVRRN